MDWCTAQCKMLLFCAKTIVKEEEEEEEEEERRSLVTFWFGTFMVLFRVNGCVFHHENAHDRR